MKRETLSLLAQALQGDAGARELAAAIMLVEFAEPVATPAPSGSAMTSAQRYARWKANGGKRSANGKANAANAPQTAVGLPLSCSPSPLTLSVSAASSERESESRSGNAREQTSQTRLQTVAANGAANAVAPVAVAGERYVAPDDLLGSEAVSIAEMVGVQDVPSAWLKFTGHYAGKWVHVAGAWQKWCATEAKHERVERERERDRAKNSAAPLTAEGLDPNSYEAAQLRKKRRKAEQDAEVAEVRARLEAQKASAQ